MALRVVFFGNSESALSNRHFHALMETPCEVVAVVDTPPSGRRSTNPAPLDSPGFVEVTRRRGAPAFEPAGPNRPEFVRAMRKLTPDLFVAVGYTNLLKEQILSVPRMLTANFHASLLPAYRGRHPVFWALRNGERRAGLTVHVMDSDFDTGDVLYQVKVRTRRDDTVSTLYERIMARSVLLVGRLIEDARAGRLRRMPQSEDGASYYSSVSVEDFRLDWSWEAEELRRLITITPGQCFCDIAGRRVFFMDAAVVGAGGAVRPGEVILISRGACTIAAGRDAVRVRRVRLEPAEEMSMAALCRELGLGPGDSLA